VKDRDDSPWAKADGLLVVEVAADHKRSRCTYGQPAGARGGERPRHAGREESGAAHTRAGHPGAEKTALPTRAIESGGAAEPATAGLRPSGSEQAWVAGVTCVWTNEGRLFLAVMLDLFARKVAGWSTSEVNDTCLALAARHAALRTRRPPKGLVYHSDRGSPYAGKDYRALETGGLVPSMSPDRRLLG
jgi:putative transposase